MKGLNTGSHFMRALKFVHIRTQNTITILPLQGKKSWTSKAGVLLLLLLTKRSFSPFFDYTNRRTKNDPSTGKECFNPCSCQRETNYSVLISERRSSLRVTWPHARMCPVPKRGAPEWKANDLALWLFLLPATSFSVPGTHALGFIYSTGHSFSPFLREWQTSGRFAR